MSFMVGVFDGKLVGAALETFVGELVSFSTRLRIWIKLAHSWNRKVCSSSPSKIMYCSFASQHLSPGLLHEFKITHAFLLKAWIKGSDTAK